MSRRRTLPPVRPARRHYDPNVQAELNTICEIRTSIAERRAELNDCQDEIRTHLAHLRRLDRKLARAGQESDRHSRAEAVEAADKRLNGLQDQVSRIHAEIGKLQEQAAEHESRLTPTELSYLS
jgi:predicted  nucleic acid-binding Zn-ribbon protein